MSSFYARGSFLSLIREKLKTYLKRLRLLTMIRPLYRKTYEVFAKNRTLPVEVSGLRARFAAPTLDHLEAIVNLGSEADELPVFLDLVSAETVLWDVGANIGLYSILASGKSKSATIVAFEPEPTNAVVLKRNIANNSLVNIRVFPFALSDETKVARLYGSPMLPAWFSLFPRPGLTPFGEVEVRAGDELVESGMIPSPTLLKIDAEGFEFEVLTGLKKTLATVDDCVIMLEHHDSIYLERGVPPRREVGLLEGLGFRLTRSEPTWRKSFWAKHSPQC